MSAKSEKKETLLTALLDPSETDLGLLEDLGPDTQKLMAEGETELAAYRRHRDYINSLPKFMFIDEDGRLKGYKFDFNNPGYYLDVLVKKAITRILQDKELIKLFLYKNSHYAVLIAREMFRLMKNGRGLENAFLVYNTILQVTPLESEPVLKDAFTEVMEVIISRGRLLSCINSQPDVPIDKILAAVSPATRQKAIAQMMEDPAAIRRYTIESYWQFLRLFEPDATAVILDALGRREFVFSLENVAELTDLCARYPTYKEQLIDNILFKQENAEHSFLSQLFKRRAWPDDLQSFFDLCDDEQRLKAINLIFPSSDSNDSFIFLTGNDEVALVFLRVAKQMLGEEAVRAKLQAFNFAESFGNYGFWLKALQAIKFSNPVELALQLSPPEKSLGNFYSFFDNTPGAVDKIFVTPGYLEIVFREIMLFEDFVKIAQKEQLITCLKSRPDLLIHFLQNTGHWKRVASALPEAVSIGQNYLLENQSVTFTKIATDVPNLSRCYKTLSVHQRPKFMDNFFANKSYQLKVFSTIKDFLHFCKLFPGYQHQALEALFNTKDLSAEHALLGQQLLGNKDDLRQFLQFRFLGASRYEGHYSVTDQHICKDARDLYTKNKDMPPVSSAALTRSESDARSDDKGYPVTASANSSRAVEVPQETTVAGLRTREDKRRQTTASSSSSSYGEIGRRSASSTDHPVSELSSSSATLESPGPLTTAEISGLGLKQDNELQTLGLKRGVTFFIPEGERASMSDSSSQPGHTVAVKRGFGFG